MFSRQSLKKASVNKCERLETVDTNRRFITQIVIERHEVPQILAKPVAGARSMNLNASFPSSCTSSTSCSCFFGYVSRFSVHVIDTTIYVRRRTYDFPCYIRSHYAIRSICIHKSYGIKYRFGISMNQITVTVISTDVSINRVRSFAFTRMLHGAACSFVFIPSFTFIPFPPLFVSACNSLFYLAFYLIISS